MLLFIKDIIGRYKIQSILFNGSWQSNSLPSLRSEAKFERTNSHMGNEMSLIVYSISSQEYWSMLGRVNQLTEIENITRCKFSIKYG